MESGSRSADRSTPPDGCAIARAILVPIALLVLAHPVAGQAPDTLVACYVPASGTVYRIAAAGLPADCLAAEHARFSWARLTTASGDLRGSFPSPTVAGLQGTQVAAAPPAAGQVLTFIDGAWRPVAPAGGGVTAHAQLSGLASDDHPQYLLSQGVRESLNGFAVTGTAGSGAIPASGGGTRMMWYPGKAAFRAGLVFGNEWDEPNVGRFSTAIGESTRAGGYGATALGAYTTASGDVSTAMGASTTASATASTAMGSSTTASATASTAMGDRTTASGGSSTAMGDGTTASGVVATAMGNLTTARGRASTAMGMRAVAEHAGTFSWSSTTATGTIPADSLRSTGIGQFSVRAVGGVRMFTNEAMTSGVTMNPGGSAWNVVSDRNRKSLFLPVDGEDVLLRLRQVPVTTWRYDAEEDATARHIGPMAQDWHRAFGFSSDSLTINQGDFDGVNLAAIQALERRTRELQERTAQVEALTARIEALERLLAGSRPGEP